MTEFSHSFEEPLDRPGQTEYDEQSFTEPLGPDFVFSSDAHPEESDAPDDLSIDDPEIGLKAVYGLVDNQMQGLAERPDALDGQEGPLYAVAGPEDVLIEVSPGPVECKAVSLGGEMLHIETPSPEQLTSEMWRDILGPGMDSIGARIEGNMDSAVTFMSAFGMGVQFVHIAHRSRGVSTTMPGIVIDNYGESQLHSFAFEPRTNNILIRAAEIHKADAAWLSRPMRSTSPVDGRVTFVGSGLNHVLLSAVEEAHHGVHSETTGDHRGSGVQGTLTVPEYDSIEHEYQALRWQRVAAEVFNMPPETVTVLDRRLQEAEDYRKNVLGLS
jgi:hypothetical protein